MKKLLRKDAVGAVLYVQAINMTEQDDHTLPNIEGVLAQNKQVFKETTQLPPERAINHKIPL
jgi:hypothetical protein